MVVGDFFPHVLYNNYFINEKKCGLNGTIVYQGKNFQL